MSLEVAAALGGTSGGWSFWRAALAALEVAIERSREREQAFASYPPGELRRFLVEVDDALGLAELAVAVQTVVNGDAGLATIADVLAERVRELGAEVREGKLPPAVASVVGRDGRRPSLP